ncbi:hypothetical protein CFHF_15585 [Caulobacter flavus]|jgi:TPR repeat protein|uniref:Sel1 repeat family protein n=1 Tax=Caulobacter flavus TaxID=1679497 RepID=A0A2N5CRK1_9CAUL|nr:tetratricopeptide repeat protein [Caulobacter flavus]AYV46321.1 hypothetical protein C1707_08665 [Caulobacter flavus]PLR11990.1 hypothetical protein CFHF_15585 [Caulobacter flavus]
MIETEALLHIAFEAEEAGDYARAREGYARCADLGDVTGLTNLAYMHDTGLGAPPDKDEAMRLYRRAWRRATCTVSANNIAILYRERGDHRAMVRWFARGAAAGDDSACLQLAKCYLEGVGVRRSVEAAVRCLARVLASDTVYEDDIDQAEALMEPFRPRLA